MKKARYFFNQMSPEEQQAYREQFKIQKPDFHLDTWLDKNHFKTFSYFLENSFDYRKLIKGTDRTGYRFWFDVMIKYNVETPMNFTEL